MKLKTEAAIVGAACAVCCAPLVVAAAALVPPVVVAGAAAMAVGAGAVRMATAGRRRDPERDQGAIGAQPSGDAPVT